eukprot:800602-Rhodomonas_salina.1
MTSVVRERRLGEGDMSDGAGFRAEEADGGDAEGLCKVVQHGLMVENSLDAIREGFTVLKWSHVAVGVLMPDNHPRQAMARKPMAKR